MGNIMETEPDQDDCGLTSLTVVLPLALTGFIVAAGCWTLFAVAGVHLRQHLDLSSVQFSLLLALPMAVGALLAIPAGLAAVFLGARTVMIACLAGLAACMALMLAANTFAGYLVVSTGLGLAAGFYSAGLQFVISHSPPRRIGLALGLFGAGVTGVGINYYLVPLIDRAFSWQGVPLAYLVVLLLVIALLLMLTEEEMTERPAMRSVLGQLSRRMHSSRMWRPCLYFGVLAGSFFALALWLPDFFSAQFQLPVESGARLALWFVIPGALAQIAGGWLSDQWGAQRLIQRALIVCIVALFVLSYPPMTLIIRGIEEAIEINIALPVVLESLCVLVLGMAMGCAMGGVQCLMVAENQDGAAVAAGFLLVSACSVAFILSLLFGGVNQWLGIRSAVFMILFVLFVACLILLSQHLRRSERATLLHSDV